ncbi:FAD/NAD(P)-binding protein [Streptomyces sp. CRN 30]|uniref:FAD/NAD(P)-binding protein n=1 Tax=Streptomyces sp. CRN 30 TaxID=3075613 RepID=UPI002A82AA4B|nr:FAD/NAD(P)-binding protein [Streptomyces sp. CRN 30]
MPDTPGDTGLVIVGGGPRGISVLDRVVTRAPADATSFPAIVLVEPVPGGGGKVWRPDQPAGLLMNTMNADNTVFPDGSVRLDSPVGTGPTFLEWLRHIAAEGHPDTAVRDFARNSTERDYAPRRVYGFYLADALAAVHAEADRKGLRVQVLTDSVERVVPAGPDGYGVALASGRRLAARAVVLATGHLDAPGPGPRPAAGPRRLPGGHPGDYPLEEMAPASEVLLRGGGLNAYDVLELLTAGRGGRFGERGYEPSGREPRIWITTRRGVPYRARVDTLGVRVPVAHLTPERVAELAARERLDFRRDVLPLYLADLELAWYDRVLALHRAELGPDAADLPGPLTADRVPQVRRAAPERWRFDPEAFASPLRGRRFADPAALQEWFAAHLDADLAAATDPALPPAAALAVAARQARPALIRLVTAGRLTGESYRRDVLGHLNGFANFLSAGPPARRVRELRALVAAGVVRLLGPATPDGHGGWRADLVDGKDEGDGLTVRPDTVVDAWMPPVDVAAPGGGLVRRMVADGVARPHRLPSQEPGGAPLPTGALDVRTRDGRVYAGPATAQDPVHPAHPVHPALFAVGVPLEGVRWTTAIGARPGTDAAFFHETDRVAAEALAHLATHHPAAPTRATPARTPQEPTP